MWTKYHSNGVVKSITHMVNNRYHRDDGPAYQEWNDAGKLIAEEWYQNGLPHKNNNPDHFAERNGPDHFAERNGPDHFAERNGPDHFALRNGPARQEWNNAGQLIMEEWWQNGRLHRDNGPAHQWWNNTGVLTYESWYQNGRRHRDDGPAIQLWNDAGVLIRDSWWQNGRKLTPQEIERILRPVDIMAVLCDNLPQPIFEEIAGVYRVI